MSGPVKRRGGLGFFAALAAAIPAFGHLQSTIGGVMPPAPGRTRRETSPRPKRRKKIKLKRAERLAKHQPHSPPQVHIIQHHSTSSRTHHWLKPNVDIDESCLRHARAGDWGRCTIEFINGFGQVTKRERYS